MLKSRIACGKETLKREFSEMYGKMNDLGEKFENRRFANQVTKIYFLVFQSHDIKNIKCNYI